MDAHHISYLNLTSFGQKAFRLSTFEKASFTKQRRKATKDTRPDIMKRKLPQSKALRNATDHKAKDALGLTLQAHQLADEDEDDDEDGEEIEDDQAGQEQKSIHTTPPFKASREPSRPAKSPMSKPSQELGTSGRNVMKSPSNGRAAGAGPTASRISALKAKLEADKAKKAVRFACSSLAHQSRRLSLQSETQGEPMPGVESLAP